jgi:hypothetical protein
MSHPRWVFALILMAAALLAVSCAFPVIAWPPAPDQGVLEVTIDYTGSFYRETFDYSRDAANIRHFALVVPENEAARADPGWIFTSLTLQADGVTVRDDRQEYAWALDYIHEAPQGYFTGQFEPGTYAVAVAFIASPLSREEAGVGEDVILWPGITGGGASTGYQIVTLDAGETTSITFGMTDADGWACPWLYVFDGHAFERRAEILRHLRGPDRERMEITPIGPVTVVNGFIVVRVSEEKDEVAFIDALVLLIDGVTVRAEGDSLAAAQVAAADGAYLILRQGEAQELRFRVPASFASGDLVSVVVTGYYLPGVR